MREKGMKEKIKARNNAQTTSVTQLGYRRRLLNRPAGRHEYFMLERPGDGESPGGPGSAACGPQNKPLNYFPFRNEMR